MDLRASASTGGRSFCLTVTVPLLWLPVQITHTDPLGVEPTQFFEILGNSNHVMH